MARCKPWHLLVSVLVAGVLVESAADLALVTYLGVPASRSLRV